MSTPRFTRAPLPFPLPSSPVELPDAAKPSERDIAAFIYALVRTQVSESAEEMLLNAVEAVVADDSAPNIVRLINTVAAIQVGEDEAHSPLLVALVDHLGIAAPKVELGQDIALAGRDLSETIAEAVEAGDPRQAIWSIMAVVAKLAPELEEDIAAIQALADQG